MSMHIQATLVRLSGLYINLKKEKDMKFVACV